MNSYGIIAKTFSLWVFDLGGLSHMSSPGDHRLGLTKTAFAATEVNSEAPYNKRTRLFLAKPRDFGSTPEGGMNTSQAF